MKKNYFSTYYQAMLKILDIMNKMLTLHHLSFKLTLKNIKYSSKLFQIIIIYQYFEAISIKVKIKIHILEA
jgi:hypothetical protein